MCTHVELSRSHRCQQLPNPTVVCGPALPAKQCSLAALTKCRAAMHTKTQHICCCYQNICYQNLEQTQELDVAGSLGVLGGRTIASDGKEGCINTEDKGHCHHPATSHAGQCAVTLVKLASGPNRQSSAQTHSEDGIRQGSSVLTVRVGLQQPAHCLQGQGRTARRTCSACCYLPNQPRRTHCRVDARTTPERHASIAPFTVDCCLARHKYSSYLSNTLTTSCRSLGPFCQASAGTMGSTRSAQVVINT